MQQPLVINPALHHWAQLNVKGHSQNSELLKIVCGQDRLNSLILLNVEHSMSKS